MGLAEAIGSTTTISSTSEPRAPGVAQTPCVVQSVYMVTFVDASAQNLARRIRLERQARGGSLAELGERAGVARAAIHEIEVGRASSTAV